MSTGGLASLLFQEDEEKVSFDTQDARELDELMEGIENDLKKRGGDGFNDDGDTSSFLSEDDVWILERVDMDDNNTGIITIEEGASVSPVAEPFYIPNQVPGSVGITIIEDGESFSPPNQVPGGR